MDCSEFEINRFSFIFVCLELNKCGVLAIVEGTQSVPHSFQYNKETEQRSISVHVPAYEGNEEIIITMHASSTGEWHHHKLKVKLAVSATWKM